MANTMANNSKRRAFTIVELVIVIAVIAILATVLITTFTGVIQSANVSADKQLLSSLNTQISMYIGKGNEINTAEDIKVALNSGDIDYWEKLDPKSASYGYHYWYNPTEQKIELATYDELGNANIKAEPIGKFLGEVTFPKARIAEGFEASSPRALKGYYFLDVVGENNNVIATFYDEVEKMSMDGADYAKSLKKLELSNNDKNKTLANAIIDKMSQTAIVTNKGVFINAATTEQVITNIYIPENLTDNKDSYYLSCEVVNVKNENVNDLTKFETVNVGTITLPENVKVGEGCLNAFGDVNVNITIDTTGTTLVEKLPEIFHAESVKGDITINGSTQATINGNKITVGSTEVTLAYRNPVTSFDMSATGNVVIKTENNYIALDAIKNGISLTLTATNFVGADANLPLYKDIDWTADNGVTVDDYGVVTFPADFNADTVTFTGTATAVNEGTVVRTFTVNVVRVKNATVSFKSGNNVGAIEIANGGNYTDAKFRVDYESANTVANFAAISTVKYADKRGTGAFVDFTAEELATLKCTTPKAKFTTGEGAYFTVSADYAVSFDNDKVASLGGSIGTQAVTVKVSDATGDVFTATVNVKVNDNTNNPFTVATPSYKDTTYVYKVGNGNAIALREFFAKREGVADLSEYKVYVYDKEPVLFEEGEWYKFQAPVATYNTPDVTTEISFTGTGLRWIVLATGAGTEEGDAVIEGIVRASTVSIIKVDVVNGLNVTEESQFRTPDSGVSLVLHNDITNTKNEDTVVSIVGAHIYGNYFTVTADKYLDSDRNAGDGYSLIAVSGGTEENPSTINQLIINGPVYKNAAMGADDPASIKSILNTLKIDGIVNPNGNFCNGINADGGYVVVNGSYIYGFNSNVRVNKGSFVANDTIFEGGAWSNIFIANATEFKLKNCTTLQERNGYTTTMDNSGDTVIGMGIYLHNTMNNQTETLTIELDNTKQYNWLSLNDTKDSAMFVKLAGEQIFKDGSPARKAEFIHTVDKTEYVNCGVLSVGVDLKLKTWVSSKNVMSEPHTEKFSIEPTNGTYVYFGTTTEKTTDVDTGLGVLGNGLYADVVSNVHSYRHGDQANCDCANEVNFTYSIAEFLATKIN